MFAWRSHGCRLGFLPISTERKSGLRSLSSTPTKNRKFLQFTTSLYPENLRLGYIDGNDVVDINGRDFCIPSSMYCFLQRTCYMDIVKTWKDGLPLCKFPLDKVCLKPPIQGMDKILCIGLNYKDYCKQQNMKPPSVPMVFSKFSSSIIGPNESVLLRTEVTKQVDWEVELCVVMGKKASCVKASDAYDYVFGYTIAQDISARDWQKKKNGGQFLLGKSMDTFCPIGPWIVTKDEIGDPSDLALSCTVNGVYKQRSNTKFLVHSIPSIIERISSVMTLLPGDLILTGTPGGVGASLDPPEFLKPGDTLCSEIEGIGTLHTKVEKYEQKCTIGAGCDKY